MDLNQYVTATGDFLLAKDVQDNPSTYFIILSEGELVENKFGNERLHLEGEFNEKKKIFDCSKTNARIIVEKLGIDSKSWVGKRLLLETYRTKTSSGEMTDAINIKQVVVDGKENNKETN